MMAHSILQGRRLCRDLTEASRFLAFPLMPDLNAGSPLIRSQSLPPHVAGTLAGDAPGSGLGVCFELQYLVCDATMYHMKKASIHDLRYGFPKIERLLRQGGEIHITKRRRVIARLVPENAESATQMPDFLERLRTIYGGKTLKISGTELIAQDRSRY